MDVGSGSGVGALAAAKPGRRVVVCDVDSTRIEDARSRLGDAAEFMCTDAATAMSRFEHLDTVLLLHVLEHIEQPEELLASIRAKAGRLLVEVPDLRADPANLARFSEGRPLYSDADHVSEFTMEGLAATLLAAGWYVTNLESRDGSIFAVGSAEIQTKDALT